MSLRAVIIRVILVLLALTAATAVIGIFIPGTTFIWRLVGTGAIGIVVGGVGLRFATLIDRPRTQVAGLAGLVGCAVIGLIAGSWVMGVMELLTPGADAEWWMTLVLLIAATVMIVAALGLRGVSERAAGAGLLVVTGLSVALGLFSIWGATSLGDLLQHTLWIFWTVAWFGTLLAVALIGIRRPNRSTPLLALAIRMTGVLAACVGAVFMWIAMWFSGYPQVPVGALAANAVALPIALWTVLELCRVPPRLLWLPVLTALAAAIAMGSLAIGAWLDHDAPLWQRLFAAASIVTVCGIFATLVISRVARSIEPPTRVADLADSIDLHCPLCALRQKIPVRVGNAPAEPGSPAPTCSRCGLELVVIATVPKCASCEHILLWATTPSCPECGAARHAETSPSGA